MDRTTRARIIDLIAGLRAGQVTLRETADRLEAILIMDAPLPAPIEPDRTKSQRYLAEVAREHGGNWPQAALARLLWLHANRAWTREELAGEYEALLSWAIETLQAGIAFLQA